MKHPDDFNGVGKAEHDYPSTDFFCSQNRAFCDPTSVFDRSKPISVQIPSKRDVLVVQLLENDQNKAQGSNPSARTVETSDQENKSLKWDIMAFSRWNDELVFTRSHPEQRRSLIRIKKAIFLIVSRHLSLPN